MLVEDPGWSKADPKFLIGASSEVGSKEEKKAAERLGRAFDKLEEVCKEASRKLGSA
jgi:hypothetical protein